MGESGKGSEATPVGSNSPYRDEEWVTRPNRQDGILLPQPATMNGRLTLAKRAKQNLDVPLPILVDRMDDNGWSLCGKGPASAYLIDAQGCVALRQGWVDPPALKEAMEGLLAKE